jgi:hypothetical protein
VCAVVFSSPTRYSCSLLYWGRRWTPLLLGVHVLLLLTKPA